MPVPQRTRFLRTHFPLLGALALLGLLASSCARELPLAPRAASTRHLSRLSYNLIGEGAEQQVMATLRHGVNAARLAAEYGATLDETSSWGCVTMWPQEGESPEDLAKRLGQDPRVLTAERNGYLEPAETRQESFSFDDGIDTPQAFLEQPAAAALHVESAHGAARGDGIVVAILDTGIDPGHNQLSGRLAGGWDYVSGDADPTDQGDGIDGDGDGNADEALGHGTHVAGIVSLVAPNARLMILRVLDADGRGTMMSVASGVWYAIDHGARVINMSLGSLSSSKAIDYALDYAERAGIVCVASAGNWGSETPQEFPASSDHVLAVAATDASARPATFTSYGSHVALCAPGVAVRSAFPGNEYRLWSGTSMSAPFVSGAAALLLSLHPGWGMSQVSERLLTTTAPLVDVPSTEQGLLGAGMLDAGGALATEPRLPSASDPSDPGTVPDPGTPGEIERPR